MIRKDHWNNKLLFLPEEVYVPVIVQHADVKKMKSRVVAKRVHRWQRVSFLMLKRYGNMFGTVKAYDKVLQAKALAFCIDEALRIKAMRKR